MRPHVLLYMQRARIPLTTDTAGKPPLDGVYLHVLLYMPRTRKLLTTDVAGKEVLVDLTNYGRRWFA